MLKNYFTVAIRNFWRNKFFAFINITGLSIGISAALIIFLIVSYDLGFDKFHKDGDRIYRVTSNLVVMGEDNLGPGVNSHLAEAVSTELTGVDAVVPLYTWDKYPSITVAGSTGKQVVLKGQKNIVFTDAAYFTVFNYTWVAGKASSLNQPYQAVITESAARLYFPGKPVAQVVGKHFAFNDTCLVTVTGIVKDIEHHTDFTFNVFVSQPTLKKTVFKGGNDLWENTQPSNQVFVKLSSGETPSRFTAKLNTLFNAHYKRAAGDNTKIVLGLQPLYDLHFNASYGNYFDNHLANKSSLTGLFMAAVFLLLLACINFINLTTANASQRIKEIGVRKTMGSSKKQLVTQFLGETFMLTLIATLLSVAITPLLLGFFADFIPVGVHLNIIKQPGILIFLLALVVVVSLLSGLYPSLILSAYKPVLALKNVAGNTSGKTHKAWLRKSLTVTQFVIAQVFIIATVIVSKQVNYSVNKGLGFKKDAILYFRTNPPHNEGPSQALLQKIKAIPGVAMVSLSSNPPSTTSGWSGTMKYNNGKTDIETEVDIKLADTNYIKLYQMQSLAGTNLPDSDTANSVIINETYCRALGFTQPQQAIGKIIKWYERRLPVVGVVADFHQSSFHDVIQPLIISNWGKNTGVFNVALQPQNAESTLWQTTIAQVEKAFKEVYPKEDAFNYKFVDDTLAKYYTAEKNMSRLLAWATGVSVLISSLGLLALVIFITNQRTKEIGIRKVVGATVTQLMALLTKDFIKLILLAFAITIPIAWWGANKWLQNFAYKTSLSWWVFAVGVGGMLLIACAVMLAKTFKAARANPVEALKAP